MKKPTSHIGVEHTNPLSKAVAAWLEANPDVPWAELDRRAGVPNSTTRAIMAGRIVRPSLAIAESMATGMGTTLSEIMLPEEHQQVREILALTRKLSEEERQMIVDLAKGLHDTRYSGRKRHFAKIG